MNSTNASSSNPSKKIKLTKMKLCILQNFINKFENQLNHRVKIIRSDNGTEFKNRDMLEFYGNKGIKQEYSNARTPQQNGVAERMNRTLIEAARTMLLDSLLPTNF
ncbi:putative ribonuclease H-like domain-containing protein [Tanacetum coccineum]